MWRFVEYTCLRVKTSVVIRKKARSISPSSLIKLLLPRLDGEITGEFKRRCDFPIISNIVLRRRTDNLKVHPDYQRRLKRRLYSNRNRRDEDEVIK
ncbi:hypothetical protein Bca101_039219 [Brassica carinata]